MARLRVLCASFLFAGLSTVCLGQLSIDTIGLKETIDFTGFDGSGFTSTPGAGQLDSDNWQILGLQSGNTVFGGTYTTGSYANGTSSGAVSAEGIYAFDVGGSNGIALGVQPDPNDFTPGSLTLRLQNNTGTTLSGIDVEYDYFIFNDTARSNSITFSYSLDNSNYVSVPSLDRASTATADPGPVTWTSELALNATIGGLALGAGNELFLRWSSDRVGGGGSTDDQIAIDNIGITAIPEPRTYALFLGALAILIAATRKKGSNAKH